MVAHEAQQLHDWDRTTMIVEQVSILSTRVLNFANSFGDSPPPPEQYRSFSELHPLRPGKSNRQGKRGMPLTGENIRGLKALFTGAKVRRL